MKVLSNPALFTRQNSKMRFATGSAGVNFLTEKGCALEKDLSVLVD